VKERVRGAERERARAHVREVACLCVCGCVCVFVCMCACVRDPARGTERTCAQVREVQVDDEDSEDALSCRSFFAKEPLIIGLFCGK